MSTTRERPESQNIAMKIIFRLPMSFNKLSERLSAKVNI